MRNTVPRVRAASTLVWVIGLPIGLGLLAGYGLHYFQASQIREDFSPYRSSGTALAQSQAVKRAFSYISRPMNVDFGEIENFKRYRTEWDIVNSGLKPLEIELVSKTCDVELNGGPMSPNSAIGSRIIGTLGMSWVVDNSDHEFHHEVVLKTNDDVQARRELRFQVHGTVSQMFDILPPTLDFGTLTAGQTKELTAQVLCFRTKKFTIEDVSFSDEAVRQGFEVKIERLEDLRSFGTDRPPAAAYSITVSADADKLGKRKVAESLLLRSNSPDTEGLKIRLQVDSQ